MYLFSLPMNELSVLTWNIWFEEILEAERLTSLLTMVCAYDPDVLCLQEVRPNIYNILLKKLKDYKYHYPNKIQYNYGCVIISKYPLSQTISHPFTDSSMGRELLVATVDYPHQKTDEKGVTTKTIPIIISTTHFESVFKKYQLNKVKIQQFAKTKKILDELANKYKNIILCADCNILPNEEEYFFTDDSDTWKDSWVVMGTSENKYTYDGENNIYMMLKNQKYKSRLDRILFRTDNCTLIEYNLAKGIDGLPEPSDHFGVFTKFNVKCSSD